MDDPAVLSMVIGIGVIVLIGGLGLVMSRSSGSAAEDRLAGLDRRTQGEPRPRSKTSPAASWPGRPRSTWAVLRSGPGMIPNAENLNLLYEQADVSFSFKRFMAIVGGLALAGAVFGVVFRLPIYADPAGGGLPGRAAVLLADAAQAASGSASSSRRCPRRSS